MRRAYDKVSETNFFLSMASRSLGKLGYSNKDIVEKLSDKFPLLTEARIISARKNTGNYHTSLIDTAFRKGVLREEPRPRVPNAGAPKRQK